MTDRVTHGAVHAKIGEIVVGGISIDMVANQMLFGPDTTESTSVIVSLENLLTDSPPLGRICGQGSWTVFMGGPGLGD